MFFIEQKLILMNLHSTVAESVIVLRSKTKLTEEISKTNLTKKLLYLIGFEDEFVSNVLLENEEVSYEIVQKHQLKEVSIQSLIELHLNYEQVYTVVVSFFDTDNYFFCICLINENCSLTRRIKFKKKLKSIFVVIIFSVVFIFSFEDLEITFIS